MRAHAVVFDGEKVKVATRLGTEQVKGIASTDRTIAVAYLNDRGAGYVKVLNIDTGLEIHRFDFGPESER